VRRRSTGARRFVEALLGNRRPPRFEADPEEARMLQVAAALRGARPATDLPSEEFVSRLEQRLRSELEAAPPPAGRLASRRRFLLGGGLAAAAVAAGVATDVSLHHGDEEQRPQEALVPVAGGWMTVATLADLADGRPRRFLAGSVEGVLVPGPDGSVHALSAICTHLGCLLQPQATGLLCPCHGARFDLQGRPVNREYLNPLPRLRSRVVGGEVQVLAV
jgi:cytochrome b6-f complex iron-sulfur subunit